MSNNFTVVHNSLLTEYLKDKRFSNQSEGICAIPYVIGDDVLCTSTSFEQKWKPEAEPKIQKFS